MRPSNVIVMLPPMMLPSRFARTGARVSVTAQGALRRQARPHAQWKKGHDPIDQRPAKNAQHTLHDATMCEVRDGPGERKKGRERHPTGHVGAWSVEVGIPRRAFDCDGACEHARIERDDLSPGFPVSNEAPDLGADVVGLLILPMRDPRRGEHRHGTPRCYAPHLLSKPSARRRERVTGARPSRCVARRGHERSRSTHDRSRSKSSP